ncbi:hypothetical protein Btru_006091 [Bulinus truncatus]|nr:hypothetical protein Btru_006091 [Bulinus truncatus]
MSCTSSKRSSRYGRYGNSELQAPPPKFPTRQHSRSIRRRQDGTIYIWTALTAKLLPQAAVVDHQASGSPHPVSTLYLHTKHDCPGLFNALSSSQRPYHRYRPLVEGFFRFEELWDTPRPPASGSSDDNHIWSRDRDNRGMEMTMMMMQQETDNWNVSLVCRI